MIVRCVDRCWDGKKCRLYHPGDQDDIDPMSPIAKYFEGWPPGTEVFTKNKGKSGSRIVPGEVKKEEPREEINPDDGNPEPEKRGRGRPLGSGKKQISSPDQI